MPTPFVLSCDLLVATLGGTSVIRGKGVKVHEGQIVCLAEALVVREETCRVVLGTSFFGGLHCDIAVGLKTSTCGDELSDDDVLFETTNGSLLPCMAASVSTRVVSWKEAADNQDSVASDALVIPMTS